MPTIENVYAGSAPIAAVYVGENAVWSATLPEYDPIDPLGLAWTDLWWTAGPNFVAAGHTPDGALSTWENEIGGRPALAQATGANQPTYRAASAALGNQPAVQFDGTNDYMAPASPGSLAQDYTVVVIAHISSVAAQGVLFGNSLTLSAERGIGIYTAGEWTLAYGTILTGATAVAGAYVLMGYVNATSSTLKSQNATVVAAGNAGSSAASIRNVGGGSSSRHLACSVSMIGVLDRALTGEEEAGFLALAEQTYGIT